MKHSFLLATLALLLPFGAFAQGSAQQDRVRVEFSTIGFNTISGEVWFRPSEREPGKALTAPLTLRSPRITYVGPSLVPLYAGNPAVAKGEPLPAVIGQIQFSPKITRALVILFQLAPGRVVALVTDDDPVTFPHHTFKVLNLSRATVALKIGETEITAPPMFEKTFPTGLTREEPVKKTSILMALRANETWQECMNLETTFRVGCRYLLLVNSTATNAETAPTLRVISEQLIAVPPAGKQPGQAQPGPKQQPGAKPPPGKPAPNTR